MERDEKLISKFTDKLNEFIKEWRWPYWYRLRKMEYLWSLSWRHFWSCWGNDRITQTDLISKECMLVKWIVEKHKINTRNLNLQVFMSMFSNDGTVEISYEELILMLLAISDEPIELLISILKQDD